MAEQPPKSDEDIANAAMQDIYTNVTSAREVMAGLRHEICPTADPSRHPRGEGSDGACALPDTGLGHAGTVTCAGKAYKDITYAALSTAAGSSIVTLWQGAVHEEFAYKHITPKDTIILNSEMACEFEDLQLHIAGE